MTGGSWGETSAPRLTALTEPTTVSGVRRAVAILVACLRLGTVAQMLPSVFLVPHPSWPANGCYAATGGLGLCDLVPPGGDVFQLPFRCGERWTATNYSGHGYGNLDFNRAGDDGAPVLASADGTVYLYRWQASTGGHVLWIKHPNGMFTVYAHLKYKPLVSAGQAVSQGQTIGYVGSTGGSSGPHLHYEQQDRLDHAVRATFNGQPSPVAAEGDPAATLTSYNSCG